MSTENRLSYKAGYRFLVMCHVLFVLLRFRIGEGCSALSREKLQLLMQHQVESEPQQFQDLPLSPLFHQLLQQCQGIKQKLQKSFFLLFDAAHRNPISVTSQHQTDVKLGSKFRKGNKVQLNDFTP